MADSWTDPEDDKPTAARTARQVSGFRAYCPLRRCIARHGERAGYTAEHLAAADRLRAAYDGARLGFAGLKDWAPVTAAMYRPATGPKPTALKQLRCRLVFDAAWSLFDAPTRLLLAAVLLANMPLARTAEAMGQSTDRVKQRLLQALGLLVRHFDIEAPRRAA